MKNNSENIKEESDSTLRAPSPSGRDGEGLGSKAARSVASVVSGNFLSKEATIKNFPFIFFLSFLAICYIANGFYSDDQTLGGSNSPWH